MSWKESLFCRCCQRCQAQRQERVLGTQVKWLVFTGCMISLLLSEWSHSPLLHTVFLCHLLSPFSQQLLVSILLCLAPQHICSLYEFFFWGGGRRREEEHYPSFQSVQFTMLSSHLRELIYLYLSFLNQYTGMIKETKFPSQGVIEKIQWGNASKIFSTNTK